MVKNQKKKKNPMTKNQKKENNNMGEENKGKNAGRPNQAEVDVLLKTVMEEDEAGNQLPAGVGNTSQSETSTEPEFDTVYGDINFDEKKMLREIERSLSFNEDVFSERISDITGHYVEAKLVSTESLAFRDFILSLPNPTVYMTLSTDGGVGVVELNPSIFYPLSLRHENPDFTI